MSITETFKKIAKSGIDKADEFNTARKINAKKDIGKKVLGGLFEKIDPNDATEMYQKMSGYKLTKAAGIGGTVAVTGLAAANFGLKSYHKGKLGEIKGGELANTISSATSPRLERQLQMLGTEDAESAMTSLQNSMGTSQYGVEPEIVFALHELRN